MRTLLRRISTGEYFEAPGKWTEDPAVALNFKSIDRALKFVETWALEEVELAFAFRDTNQITRVPLERISTHYLEE